MTQSLKICLIVLLLVRAAAAADRIAAAQVQRAVEQFVLGELAGERAAGERVEVRTRWQNDITLEGDGRPEIRIRRLSGKSLRGPTVLRMAIAVDGRVEKEMSVTADVCWFRPVLVASRGLRRGEMLTGEPVELEERDVTQERDGYFTAAEDLVGLRLRRNLRPGEVLTRGHLEPIPVVQQGDEITLLLETATLRISTLGTALQDGGVGERIRVRNADSGKVIYGKVVDPGTVRIGL